MKTTRFSGVITFFPDIMLEEATDENSTACLCSDIQRNDYSPFFEWANYTTIILALPMLSIFGVLTNIINVFLYSRKRLQNSANTYLLFLACSDFMVIVTGLFIFWIDSARSYIPELTHAPYTTVYTLPFGYMAQTCSIYFTVAAAVDCFVNVCWPTQSRHYCSTRRAKQICVSIVVVSIMYNSLRFPQFNLRKCYNESQQQIIEICPTSLFIMINTVYNMYMYMVLMTLLPFFFLLCINVIIMKRQRGKQGDGSDVFKAEPVGGTSDDTITMIMVVILFLSCNILALVVNFIENFLEPSAVLLNFLTDTSNFLVVFNSSVNCVIYFVFNADYREMFLFYARWLWRVICDEYCCCCSCRTHQAYNVYQPVNTRLVLDMNHARNGNKLALPRLDISRDHPSMTESDRLSSPIWQPLTARHLPNVDWPPSPAVSSFEPQSPMFLVDDDVDSGCDDVSHVSSQPMTRWLAEVNIVEATPPGRRPHIVVKPIGGLPRLNGDTISITAL